MQIFVLLMMMALLAHGPAGLAPEPTLSTPALLAAVLGPYALLAAVIVLACRRAWYRLATQPARMERTLNRIDRVLGFTRLAALLLLLADLYLLGWLTYLRRTLGEWVLINDVLAVAPALSVVVLGWWAYYPIDRRIREVSIIRNLDESASVWPIGSRWHYVWSQVRHQLLLLLVPLTLLLAWSQIVQRWISPPGTTALWEPYLVFAGGIGVFLFAPVMIRYVWDTVPLPEGSLRQRLTALCRRYGVRCRQLLLWRTYGGLINGAVMGLIGPLRYILLTDGLIERMDDDHVEAVVAHELGHVKRHHMPWMMLCAISTLSGVGLVMLLGERAAGVELLSSRQPEIAGPATAGMVGAWALLFGFISRRFERQADTFAAQHLSRKHPDPDRGDGVISPQAAELVATALLRVAELNHHPPHRRSWRHGSINWRVGYLRSLVGTPIDRCPIDRHVVALRWLCAALLIGVALVETSTSL